MRREEIGIGEIYRTPGGLECKVIAMAGEKVVFRMMMPDGSESLRETTIGRFAQVCVPVSGRVF